MPKGATPLKQRIRTLCNSRFPIPEDVVRNKGDGAPCFMCGTRAEMPCRHRTAS